MVGKNAILKGKHRCAYAVILAYITLFTFTYTGRQAIVVGLDYYVPSYLLV